MKNPLAGLDIAAQVKALGGAGRGKGTRRLAEARAAVSGRSVKTEMRAVQRAMKSGRAPAKQRADVALAGEAASLRAATSISGGRVEVSYSTGGGRRREGMRDLTNGGGGFRISGDLRDAVDRAATRLERGDRRGAQDLIGEALLDAYGGLGGTLTIESWGSGVTFT